ALGQSLESEGGRGVGWRHDRLLRLWWHSFHVTRARRCARRTGTRRSSGAIDAAATDITKAPGARPAAGRGPSVTGGFDALGADESTRSRSWINPSTLARWLRVSPNPG